MGITEIFRRIWLFSANKIKSSESFSKQPTQLMVELNSSLQHIIVTLGSFVKFTLIIYSMKHLQYNIFQENIWIICLPDSFIETIHNWTEIKMRWNQFQELFLILKYNWAFKPTFNKIHQNLVIQHSHGLVIGCNFIIDYFVLNKKLRYYKALNKNFQNNK